MPMSTTMQQVYDYAVKLDEATASTDPRRHRSVIVNCEDGSVFAIAQSFIVEFETADGEPWVIVISEHYLPHVFPFDDLTGYQQLELIHDRSRHTPAGPDLDTLSPTS